MSGPVLGPGVIMMKGEKTDTISAFGELTVMLENGAVK